MQLISALAAGVKGAESGTAKIYVRGTSQRANYYLDMSGTGGFEATANQITSGADIDLDSNGGASVYVSQFVRVEVYASDGTAIRTFTEGSYDDNVEVRSQSFTGVDYETAASAASNPTPLGTALDLWYTSAGAVDFKVLFDGSSYLIKNLLGRLTGFFFNVQSPEYGALGDGTTDDRQAIQDCIDACEADGGGIVFFPEGTYHMEDGTALDVPDDVNLLGMGPSLSILSRDHATADLITLPDGNSKLQTITGLGFTDEQANTGSVIEISAGGRYLIKECEFVAGFTRPSTSDAHIHLSNTTETWVAVESCRFAVTLTTGNRVFEDGGVSISSHLYMRNCEVTPPASRTSSLIQARYVRCEGCFFDLSSVDSLLQLIELNDSAGDTSIAFFGNRVSAPASSNPFIIDRNPTNHVAFAGNQMDAGVKMINPPVALGGRTVANESALADREGRFLDITVASTIWHCDFVNHRVCRIVATTATDLNVTANIFAGGSASLFIWNNSGSGMTFSFGDGFAGTTGLWDGVLATGEVIVLNFVCVATASTFLWYLTAMPQEF